MLEAIPNKKHIRIMCASGVHSAVLASGEYDLPFIKVKFSDGRLLKEGQELWECRRCASDDDFPANWFRDYDDPEYHGATPEDNYFKKEFTEWRGSEYKKYGEWYYCDIDSDIDLIEQTLIVTTENQVEAALNYDNLRYPLFTFLGSRDFKFVMPSRIYVNTEVEKTHIENFGATIFVGSPLEYVNWTYNPFLYDMLPVFRNEQGFNLDFCGSIIDTDFFRGNLAGKGAMVYYNMFCDFKKYNGADLLFGARAGNWFCNALASTGTLKLIDHAHGDVEPEDGLELGLGPLGSGYYVYNPETMSFDELGPGNPTYVTSIVYDKAVANYNVGNIFTFSKLNRIYLETYINNEIDIYNSSIVSPINVRIFSPTHMMEDIVYQKNPMSTIKYGAGLSCEIKYTVAEGYYDEEGNPGPIEKTITINDQDATIIAHTYTDGVFTLQQPVTDTGTTNTYSYYCNAFPDSYVQILDKDGNELIKEALPVSSTQYPVNPFDTVNIVCALKPSFKSRNGILGEVVHLSYAKPVNLSKRLKIYVNNRPHDKVMIKVGEDWKQATPYIKVNGEWKACVPWIKKDSEWISIS